MPYKYFFYLQREPCLPNHFNMIRRFKDQLAADPRFESSKWRLDRIDCLEPSKKEIVNEWCRKNKIRLELLICTQGIEFTNKVDFVLGYGLGKYLTNYLNLLGVPYLDLATPGLKKTWEDYINNNQATNKLVEWLHDLPRCVEFMLPQWISANQFDYKEMKHA